MDFSNRIFSIIACAFVMTLPLHANAMSNPAASFCQKMGGRSEIAKLSDGSEVGLCFMPNKQTFEEWTFFRMHNARLLGAKKKHEPSIKASPTNTKDQ